MTPSTTLALLAALYHYKETNADDDKGSEAEEAIEMEGEEAIQRPADDDVLTL